MVTLLTLALSPGWAQSYIGSGEALGYEDLTFAPELEELLMPAATPSAGVVGGTPVEEGDWDDAVGIVFQRNYVGCTGTLIAPNVVLTADHCLGGISHVLVGSKNWYRDDQGELIVVRREMGHPRADIAVLLLEGESSYTPRPMALDCIADDYVVDGAEVAVVGFGAIDERGNQDTSRLHEGYTFVQDADCDQEYIDGYYSGCDWSISPGGEIGAGGNGVDSCFGDSGGPLYVLTDRGDYLVGVTSRSYWGAPANAPCRVGGIYVRPDAVINWIENKSGVAIPRPQCNFAPVPTAEPIATKKNTPGTTVVLPGDPDPENVHTFSVSTEPAHGSATVDETGVVTYTPSNGYRGADAFTVAVTDDGSIYEASGPLTSDLTIDVSVGGRGGDGEALGVGCGCSGTGGLPFAMWTLPLGALFLRRRR